MGVSFCRGVDLVAEDCDIFAEPGVFIGAGDLAFEVPEMTAPALTPSGFPAGLGKDVVGFKDGDFPTAIGFAVSVAEFVALGSESVFREDALASMCDEACPTSASDGAVEAVVVDPSMSVTVVVPPSVCSTVVELEDGCATFFVDKDGSTSEDFAALSLVTASRTKLGFETGVLADCTGAVIPFDPTVAVARPSWLST